MAIYENKILAIGYSKGIVLIYDLTIDNELNAAIPEE